MRTTHTSQDIERLYRHFISLAKLYHKDKLAREPLSTFWFVYDQSARNYLHAARELGSAIGKVRTFPARQRKEAA
jgi:hypothetical protein